MGTLIDALLRLSRLSRVDVNRAPLDMTEMAQGVFAEMQEHERTNGCRFEAQRGMTGSGDAGLVRTVLGNLIGNACKFSPEGGTIRMAQQGETFSVSDEGVGFDMQFAPKIFLPFERLVADSEFEGTGIGLANVERIVKRHHGLVWVESEPRKGTTFFFTLGA
jgi:signal transduction histidine kinase